MKTSEKEKLIKKHLGCNTPDWIIENCLSLLDEFEGKNKLKTINKNESNVSNKKPNTLPTEKQVIDTIIDCVDIRGIELEYYKWNFSNEQSGLFTALNKLYNV